MTDNHHNGTNPLGMTRQAFVDQFDRLSRRSALVLRKP
jgi:hypothetical protein